MAKTKRPAPKKKVPAPAQRKPAAQPTPPGPKKLAKAAPAAPPVAPALVKQSHFDERRPDAPATRLVTHARHLAKQLRVDAIELVRAKVTTADADRLELFADTLAAVEESWLALKDQREVGGLAATRAPLRDGRDQVFAALRTFAARNPDTQSALDRIGDVQDDDDLVNDATRLLALAKKHRADLDGTDVTVERLVEIRAALNDFIAARAGSRATRTAPDAEAPRPTTVQAEDELTRTARRARNRAYWMLAELDRDVVAKGQYAFRKDAVGRAKYATYRRSESGASDAPATPATPATPAKE